MDVLELVYIKGYEACHDWLQSKKSNDAEFGNIVTGVEYKRGSGKFAQLYSDGLWVDSAFYNEELCEQRNLVDLKDLQLAINNYYYGGVSEDEVFNEHQAYATEIIEGGVVLVLSENVASTFRDKIKDELS